LKHVFSSPPLLSAGKGKPNKAFLLEQKIREFLDFIEEEKKRKIKVFEVDGLFQSIEMGAKGKESQNLKVKSAKKRRNEGGRLFRHKVRHSRKETPDRKE
jgi:hypothetical protein